MAGLLSNFRNTMIVSFILALIIDRRLFDVHNGSADAIFWQAVFRWLHVLLRHPVDRAALLFQLRPDPGHAGDPGRAEAGRVEVHRARSAVLVPLGGAGHGAHGLGDPGRQPRLPGPGPARSGFDRRRQPASSTRPASASACGWASIMLLNVWGIIWPNQKRALGLVEADADTKAKAARIAMLGSRTNTAAVDADAGRHDHVPDDLRLSRLSEPS